MFVEFCHATAVISFRSIWLLMMIGAVKGFAATTEINVFISPPRGGFGDTAANLLMIERMAHYYQESDLRFNVIYPESSKGQIKALWPDFDTHVDQQIVRGILFSEIKKAPKTKLAISFSSAGRIHGADTLLEREINYFEYAQYDSEGRDGIVHPGMVRDPGDKKNPVFKISDRNMYAAAITTGLADGLYVLEGFRPEDSNKKITYNFLRRFAPLARFEDSHLLAYAYSSSPEVVQQYVQAVEKFAQKSKSSVVVVTNQNVLVSSSLVQIVSMKNMPFSLNQKLIKSSDLPVLVTGDGSLSIAIEGAKPFFYSFYTWKLNTPIQLREELFKRSKYLRKNPLARELVSQLLQLDLSGQVDYTDMFLQFMENSDLRSEFSKVLSELTRENSLVKLLRRDLQIFQSEKGSRSNNENGKEYFKLFWKIARKSDSIEEAIVKIEAYVMNRNKKAEDRLSHLLALKSVATYSNERLALPMSRILTEGDFEMKFGQSAKGPVERHRWLGPRAT